MKTILFLVLLCFAINAHGATYLLLSQTNNFAKGITNEAKAYTDAHSGGGIVGTVSNNVASAGLLAVDSTKTNGIAATKAHITNAWNIFDGDTLKFVNGAGALSAPAGGGNVVNSGASVVGMIPVYTDTSGTAVTPTNSVDLTGINVGTLYLSNMTANVVPVFDGNTNLVPSATSTNDLNAIAGKATVLSHYMGTDTNALLSALGGAPLAGATFTGSTLIGTTNIVGALAGKQPASTTLDHYAGTDTNSILAAIGGQPLLPTATWTQITPDTTNAVVNLTNAVPGVDKNFYYSITTSNYIIFSNLVQGAQGTIWINASGAPQQMQFASTYDNFSTNDLTYVSGYVWSLTNRAIIAYKVGWGTDATNVMLAVKKK